MEELEEEAFQHLLSETINEAIIRFDENFTIVFANTAVYKTFGYTKEELEGQSFRILFPPSIYRRHKEQIRKYFFVFYLPNWR